MDSIIISRPLRLTRFCPEPTVTIFEKWEKIMNNHLENVLRFKVMITPIAVQILFWIFVVLAILAGLAAIFTGEFLQGLAFIFIAPIVIRIYAELIMVIFKIHQAVQEIATKS